MSFATKLIVSLITISSAIIGSLWGAFEIIDARMNDKVSFGEVRVIALVEESKKDSEIKIKNAVTQADLKLKIVDTKLFTELSGIKNMVGSMDRKLNILIDKSKHDWVNKFDNDDSFVSLRPKETFIKGNL